MAELCGKCGSDMALVGRMHRCRPRPMVSEAVVVHAPKVVVHSPDVVVHKTEHGGSRGADRHRDTEARREYRRQWMKRRRAERIDPIQS